MRKMGISAHENKIKLWFYLHKFDKQILDNRKINAAIVSVAFGDHQMLIFQ